MIYSKIIGIGIYLPKNKISNNSLKKNFNNKLSNEWIYSRSGIKYRFYANLNIKSSDLAYKASKKALFSAKLNKNKIDLILLSSSTPDFISNIPSTACILQHKLGIKNNCPAIDVQASCSSFIYLLSIADNFIKTGKYNNILIVNSEVFSKIINFKDLSNFFLFGDAAGAIILSKSKNKYLLYNKLNSNGKYNNILKISGNINRNILFGNSYINIKGKIMFRLAIHIIIKSIKNILLFSKINIKDINWIIFHQSNIKIINHISKNLKLPNKKIINTINIYGNTSSSSIILSLNWGIKNNYIKYGNNIIINSLGSGITWGNAIIRI